MTNKRTKKQIKEDAKAMRELNDWSRVFLDIPKMAGYMLTTNQFLI